MSQFYTTTDHFVLVPAIMLALFGCAVLLFDFLIFPEPRQRKYLVLFVVLGLVFTGGALWRQQAFLSAQGLDRITAFGGSLTIDGFALFFNWIFLAASLIVALISYKYLDTAGRAPRGVLRADPAGQLRHVLPGGGDGPDHAVHRPGTDGAVLLRDGGLPARRQALQ